MSLIGCYGFKALATTYHDPLDGVEGTWTNHLKIGSQPYRWTENFLISSSLIKKQKKWCGTKNPMTASSIYFLSWFVSKASGRYHDRSYRSRWNFEGSGHDHDDGPLREGDVIMIEFWKGADVIMMDRWRLTSTPSTQHQPSSGRGVERYSASFCWSLAEIA